MCIVVCLGMCVVLVCISVKENSRVWALIVSYAVVLNYHVRCDPLLSNVEAGIHRITKLHRQHEHFEAGLPKACLKAVSRRSPPKVKICPGQFGETFG